MTTEELEQLGKLIETKLEAEREHNRKLVREEIKVSEERIKAELTAAITEKVEGLANDMAEFFHKTWEKMDETNERVTIIEDHLGLPHRTEN